MLSDMGGKFSRELGIDLTGNSPEEISEWFLAAKLFGARIPTGIAVQTFREFERRGVVTPERILGTGLDGLLCLLKA